MPFWYINSFYPESVRCWNRLGHVLRDSPNLQSFKKCLLASYTPPAPRSIFGIHDSLGIRRLFQLRVGLSPLLGRKSTQIPWYPFRQELKNNPKIFFSFIKSKKCENIGVSPLRYSKGKLHTDDKVKANLLNRQFISVFSNDDAITPTMLSTRIANMPEITVTINGVTKLLEKLNPYKVSGPDMVSARFLKEALINPIYKKGKNDRGIAENYRPISLTSVTCKLLEHIIHSNIIKHLEANEILSDTQHGFRKRRGRDTQLVMVVNDFAKNLNYSQQLDTILLGFSKAFDKVNHRKLLINGPLRY